jgi:hypothetical protein
MPLDTAAGGQEGELRVWELRSRELVSHLKQHGQRVPAVALYSDDSRAIRSVVARATLPLKWLIKQLDIRCIELLTVTAIVAALSLLTSATVTHSDETLLLLLCIHT